MGDKIHLFGSAKDSEGEILNPLNLSWGTRILHCPTGPEDCHSHPLQDFPGTTSGYLVAPEHDYPSYIEITLTAADKRGLSVSKTIKLSPRVFTVLISSDPPGIPLTAGLVSQVAPFEVPTVEGAQLTLWAPATEQLNGTTYTWQGWSDGGARVHTILAEGESQHTATYAGPVKKRPPVFPRTKIKKHPPKETRSHVADFVFASSETGSHFRCKLDRGRYRPCNAHTVFRRLRRGSHVLCVFAIDGEGDRDRTPAVFAWKIR